MILLRTLRMDRVNTHGVRRLATYRVLSKKKSSICPRSSSLLLSRLISFGGYGQRLDASHRSEFSSTGTPRFSTAASMTNSGSSSLPFLLADIGEGIHEVELLKWNVKVGDTIQQFDAVCQVQSDKATVDITSRYDGTITELAGDVGDMIRVGKPILFLETSTDSKIQVSTEVDSPTSRAEATETPELVAAVSLQDQPAAVTVVEDVPLERVDVAKVLTSPAVRRLCREHAVDPSKIPSTGPNGRLLKADVIAFLNPTNPEVGAATKVTPDASHQQEIPLDTVDVETIVELKGYSRAMAKAMTQSLDVPHMCLSEELDVTDLQQVRQKMNISTSKKISMLAILVKACSIALEDYPMMNAAQHRNDDERVSVRLQPQHLIGIAMDTPRGLVVPVLGDCSKMSMVDIQLRIDELKDHRDTLAIDTVLPTFTLSNIGAIGAGLALQPVLVPPQLAMGAIGRLQRLPRFDANNEVVATSILPITWAADHRFLDGALLARFHVRVQELIRNPWEMMMAMK